MQYPRRKRTRLCGYDYSTTNVYYVTVCTGQKAPIFGEPGNLSCFGRIAKEEMEHLPSRYRDVRVDAFAVMPNHIHVILAIGCSGPMQTAKNPTLSSVIALYKAGVSRRIHQLDPSVKVWQTSFYDEIIKNQRHYLAAWNYVAGNPQK